MIQVLCQTLTNRPSPKTEFRNYDTLEDFKAEILNHYPNIQVSLPKENQKFWFGCQYGDVDERFQFRWLYAIMDTERGCLYSLGDATCANKIGLPLEKQHCSTEVYNMLKEVQEEKERRDNSFVFVK